MTNTKRKDEKDLRVQIKTRQPGPVAPPSGFAKLRRHADLDSVDTVAEILSLPAEAPTDSSGAPRSRPAPGIQYTPGSPTTGGSLATPGSTSAPGNISAGGEASVPGKISAPRRRSTPYGKLDPAEHPTSSAADISPRRDFTKTPNSILRDVLSRGLFRGKSRDVYDYLYSRTRGAITPRQSALLTSTEIMRGANIGSDHTLRDNLRHLMLVGLIDRKVNSGAQEGNEYFVYLPEEVSLPFDREGHPLQLGSPRQVIYPGHPGQKLPGAPGAETAGGAPGSSEAGSTTYGEPKTSFKTNTDDDDEAAALSDLKSILSGAARKLTGRTLRATEREQWAELARVLVEELNEAASRAESVSSVPAFLTAHLRRKLVPKPATRKREGNQKPDAGLSTAPPTASVVRLTPEEIQSFTTTVTELLVEGKPMEEVEAQYAPSMHPADWAAVKSVAQAQGATKKGK